MVGCGGVCPSMPTGAPSSGKTPGSQTPGVLATLALDVQLDGVRKMPPKWGETTPPQFISDSSLMYLRHLQLSAATVGTVAA